MEIDLKVEASLWSDGLMKKNTPKIPVGGAIHMVTETLMFELVEHRRATLLVTSRVLANGTCNHREESRRSTQENLQQ